MYSCAKQLIRIAGSLNNRSSREVMDAVERSASRLGQDLIVGSVEDAQKVFQQNFLQLYRINKQIFWQRFDQELTEMEKLLQQAQESIPAKLRKYIIEQGNFYKLIQSNQALKDKVDAFNAKIKQEIVKIFAKHDDSFEMEEQLNSWNI